MPQWLNGPYNKLEDLAGCTEQGNFKVLLDKTFGLAGQWLMDIKGKELAGPEGTCSRPSRYSSSVGRTSLSRGRRVV